MSTALVTGATAGIGREFAVQLATKGEDLVLVARDEARLAAVAGELSGRHGVAVEVLPADLSDRAQLERVAERLRDTARPVDLLVNNAGIITIDKLEDTRLEDVERVLRINTTAVLIGVQQALPLLRASDGALVAIDTSAHVFVDARTRRPSEIPTNLRMNLEQLVAGR